MRVFDVGTLAFSAVNDAAVRHCGYSPREFLSMTILDIRPTRTFLFYSEKCCRNEYLTEQGNKATPETQEEGRQLDRRGGHALRSTLQRMHGRHRDRRRCNWTCTRSKSYLGTQPDAV